MLKKVFVLPLLAIFAFSLVGCASRGQLRQKDSEIQILKNQVSLLESQIQNKDQELVTLTEALSAKEAELAKAEAGQASVKRSDRKVKAYPTTKDFQTALKNAGYDPGWIDGRMGKKTRDAIKAFQKANDLKANGRMGKKTWALLGKYLNQKAK
ncbi:MAG: peptidoglycan-binding protein [Candidatus Omnitrophota bacterium]